MPDLSGVAPDDLSRWLAQASPDGLWVFDQQGRTVYANDRLADMLGRTPDEMPGLSVFDHLDEVGREQFREHLADLERTDHPGDNLECQLLRRDGTPFWALVSHTPVHDDDGNHVAWLHRVSDNTQQRRLIDSLQRSQHQLAEAQHIAKIGSWEWDVATDTVWWSDELYRIYEFEDRASFTPTLGGFLELVHPDDRDEVAQCVAAALDTGSFQFDCRFTRRDGSLGWIRGRGQLTRDEAGKPLRMRGTSQDVTETKDAEQALALLTSMATAANEAATLEEVLPTILRDVAQHTGWRPVGAWRVVGKDLVPVSPEDRTAPAADVGEAERLAETARQALTPQVGLSTERTHLVAAPVVAEGRAACVVVMDTRATTPPTGTDSDTVGRASALFATVAERELNAARLAQARDEAMRASRAKSEFLATMSHEIRTPLNGVIGLSELLNQTDLSLKQKRLADGIDGAGRSLLSLVNDILDLSKIEAGRLELEAVDFDPRAIVEQSTTLSAEQARAKQLELAVTCSQDFPERVCGDPVRFGQVIANLTSNAVKFTSAGEVVVRASVQQADDDGVLVRVEVTDTGRGIAPEVQERLFTAFTQGDSSTTREYGGTGLGLAISRQIVTALDGEIGVDSELDAGSTFWFTARFAPASAPVESKPTTNPIAGLRALVVDDNETNRFILEEQLEGWRAEATLAASAVEGFGLLDEAQRQGQPHDVILLDYMMPGVDGVQFARMVRADGRFDSTRILLLTSAMNLEEDALTEAGIDRALLKPVLQSHLYDALVSLIGRTDGSPGRPAPEPVEPAAEVGRRGRVLVVEDNEVNQLVAIGILESLGYAVDVAENGLAGYYAFQSAFGAYDAVLMDCQMPQMDGYDATMMIRSFENEEMRTPIIAMTASAIAGERERCLEAGMDDFLTKPVEVDVLRETLDRWVPQRDDADGERVTPSVPWVGPGATPKAKQAAAAQPTDPDAPVLVVDDDVARQVAGVLDVNRLDELLALDPEDPSLVLRMVDRFADNTGESLAALEAACAEGDPEAVEQAAHRLKGTASNLGAKVLAARSVDVELTGDRGEVPDPSAVADLARLREEALASLQTFAQPLRSMV